MRRLTERRREEIRREELLRLANSEQARSLDEILEAQRLKKAVTRALLSIPPLQERILRMRLGISCRQMTQDEVGDALNLTRHHVVRLEYFARHGLKTRARSMHLLRMFKE